MTRLLLGRNRQPILGLPSQSKPAWVFCLEMPGILKPRFVDNLTLYYVENQEYVAVEPTFIDYYVGNEPTLPRTPNHLDKDSLLKQEENWRPVSAIRKVSSDKDEELRFEFDKVETYALRLRFENLTSPIALTELQVHAKKVKKNVDRK